MMRSVKKGVVAFAVFFALLAGAAAFLFLPKVVFDLRVRGEEKSCVQFITSRMLCEKGAVKFRLPLVRKETDLTNSVLTESAGLFLQYLLMVNDRAMFDRQVNAIKEVFLAPNGLLCWEVHIPSKKKEESNASLDDLRIAQALFLGYEKWKDERYLNFAVYLAGNIRKKNVKDGFFVETCSWAGGDAVSDTVDLSYLDLGAMETLARYDPDWEAILKKSRDILEKGTIPGGLFFDKYDVRSGKYFFKDKNMINIILCAINLAQAGLPDGGVCEFLKGEWKKNGKIFGKYDPETRKPAAGFESIAVYALALRLALLEKDFDLALRMYGKVASSQIVDRRSGFYGAFAWEEAHSFDNLETLLALAELRKGYRP